MRNGASGIAPRLTRAREPAATDADSVVGAAVSVLASDVLLRAETAAPDDALLRELEALKRAGLDMVAMEQSTADSVCVCSWLLIG